MSVASTQHTPRSPNWEWKQRAVIGMKPRVRRGEAVLSANARPAQIVCLTLFLTLGAVAGGASEPPFLVKDIHPSGDSSPAELVTIGETTYFTAIDGAKGVELWKTDGTETGTMLVKDICPGICSSGPLLLTALNTSLFFIADDGSLGYELWKSDGTASGTVLVKDLYPGSPSPGTSELTAAGNFVFFNGDNGPNVGRLWKSDGTAAGTVPVRGELPGLSPSSLTAFGSTIFFSGVTTNGRELWKSDGTLGGTSMIKDINVGAGSSFPNGLTVVGNTVFFAAWTFTGMELWKSDGSAVGTGPVKDINPGSGHSWPSSLVEVGGMLFFVADDGSSGEELWKSDGSLNGTVLLKDIDPGSESSNATQLTSANGLLFFSADDGVLGQELWRSDGTAAGTFIIDIFTSTPSSAPSELRRVADLLYFAADDGVAGTELWKSDGSIVETARVDDIAPLQASSSPTEPTEAPSVIVFSADDGVTGRELWAIQVGGPVLELTKTFSVPAVETGTAGHTFTLVVTNSGVGSATNVRVTDVVDPRLAVTSISSAGDCTASTGQSVDCTFGTLSPAGSETITVTYSVGTAVQPAAGVLNTAEAGDGTQLIQASDTVDLLSPCTPLPIHLDVIDEMIDGPDYVAEACATIGVGPTVHVMGTGAATMRAGDSVTFYNGFEVDSGGELVAIIDPLQSPGS